MKQPISPNPMDPRDSSRHIPFLSDALWASRSVYARSKEVTPVYISRSRGPRPFTRLAPHPFWEFTCVVSGEGWLLHDGGRTRLAADMTLLVPPGCGHGEHSDRPMDTIWVRVEGRRIRSAPLRRIALVQDAALREAFEQSWLLSEYGSAQPIGSELDGRMAAIVARFFRLAEGHEGAAHGDLAERAVIYMTEHMAGEISISAMARHFHCSEGYLHRAFKRRTGLTPVAYLLQARCRQAAHLLEHTDWGVRAVGEATGFADPFYFSRVFRRHHGVAPRAYRQARRRSPPQA